MTTAPVPTLAEIRQLLNGTELLDQYQTECVLLAILDRIAALEKKVIAIDECQSAQISREDATWHEFHPSVGGY
jgi:hypothetical protein